MQICEILDYFPDKRSHFRLSRVTASGDSGGGVFDLDTGLLLGIMVDVETNGPCLGDFGRMLPVFPAVTLYYNEID